MKKYLILILSLWQSLSWASDLSQPQDIELQRRSQLFKAVCETGFLDYLFPGSELSSFKQNFSSFTLVSKEWNSLAYQTVKTLTVDFPFPSNFQRFQNLKELSLDGLKKDNSSIPSALTSLTHLQVLNLRYLDNIENSTVYLTALTNLKVFKAEDCFWFTNNNIQPLRNLTTLQTLHLEDLNEDNFTDIGLQIIGHLTGLKDLNLSRLSRKVTTSGLDLIFQLTQLERLSLKWEERTKGLKLTNIIRLVSLKSLTLEWLAVKQTLFLQEIEMIGRLTLLQELKIMYRKVSKEHLSNLLSSLTNLTSLDLGNCNVFEDNSLREFLENDPLPKLTYVDWYLRGASPPGGPFSVPVTDPDGYIIGYKRALPNVTS